VSNSILRRQYRAVQEWVFAEMSEQVQGLAKKRMPGSCLLGHCCSKQQQLVQLTQPSTKK